MSIQGLNIDSLSRGAPFQSLTLHLSTEAESVINQLNITFSSIYNNFANLASLGNEVTAFIESLGNNQYAASTTSYVISRLVSEVIEIAGAETAWVTLRASTPTNLFDMPRWHVDGYFYSPYIGFQYKIVVTLKGPSTLFLSLSEELRNEFKSIIKKSRLDNHEEIRAAINNFVDEHKCDHNKAQIVQVKAGVFATGNPDIAAIHSEPPINEDRLFLSVLPGTVEQIEEFHGRSGS